MPARAAPSKRSRNVSARASFVSLPYPLRRSARNRRCTSSDTSRICLAAGEVVIFDRSWYNRAGVERVMGFCSEEQVKQFLLMTPGRRAAVVDSGIILLKYWLEVSEAEQTRRLQARIDDRRKIWKLSPMDLKSYSRWYDYSRARDEMFKATDTPWAPWFVVRSDDKKRARLNAIIAPARQIPYEDITRGKVKLPKRKNHHGNREPDYPYKFVPELTWPSNQRQ